MWNDVIDLRDFYASRLGQMARRMIRRRLPEANIITFWHIPWPNPAIFAICPWREELLDGLLGSEIVGFHTPPTSRISS